MTILSKPADARHISKGQVADIRKALDTLGHTVGEDSKRQCPSCPDGRLEVYAGTNFVEFKCRPG